MIGFRRRAAALVLVTMLPLAACGDDDGLIPQPSTTQATETTASGAAGGASETTAAASTTNAPETTQAPTTTAAATTTPPTTVVSCDAPAVPIGFGETINEQLDAIDAPYPANSRYFCFSVPEGVAQVTVDLTGLTADLDLFVGFDSLARLQDPEVSSADWYSNEYGLVDEQVVIDAPDPGVYYIEIHPYDRESSPYTLTLSG